MNLLPLLNKGNCSGLDKSLEEIKKISEGKKSLGIMTRCYASRKDAMTEDFFVKLNVKSMEISYH